MRQPQLGLAALAMLLLAGAQTPPPAHIRAIVTNVDVPVLVLNASGQPVSNLGLQAFTVTDNGHPQRLSLVDNRPRPLSLAFVIDSSERRAVAQAHRAALVFSEMVMGQLGRAAVFTTAPRAREVLAFTGNRDRVASALRHIAAGPNVRNLGRTLTRAVLALEHEPSDRTRAVIVITHSSQEATRVAPAIVETSMVNGIPIFRLSPNLPKGGLARNPYSSAAAGQGSLPSVPPVGAHGEPVPGPGQVANLDLGGALRTVYRAATGQLLEYVRLSGGLNLSAHNDADFDRKLSAMGLALRSIYHLYYEPNDLTAQPALHHIVVRVHGAQVSRWIYRHRYLALGDRG